MSAIFPREQAETAVGFPAGLAYTAYAAFRASRAIAGRPCTDLAAEAERALAEADDVVRIVDLIRHLRAAEARLYTKNELPFITGIRKPLAEILADLP